MGFAEVPADQRCSHAELEHCKHTCARAWSRTCWTLASMASRRLARSPGDTAALARLSCRRTSARSCFCSLYFLPIKWPQHACFKYE